MISPEEQIIREYVSHGGDLETVNFYHFTLVISDQYLKSEKKYADLKACSAVAISAFDDLLYFMNNRLLNNHLRDRNRFRRLHAITASTEHRSKEHQTRCSTHLHAVVAVNSLLDKKLQTLLCRSYASEQNCFRLDPAMHQRLPDCLKLQIRELRIDPVRHSIDDLRRVVSYAMKDATSPNDRVTVVTSEDHYDIPNQTESFTTYKSKKRETNAQFS